jgi:anti-sigma factor RsiW
MSECQTARANFTEYLDGRLNGREMQRVSAHVDACRSCASEWKTLRETQATLALLGPVQPPEDLLLRVRVALRHGTWRGRTR